MNRIEQINYKEIKRISPSQFFSMKNCSYKSVLNEAFDKQPLLPISANAYFGTVLHKMLELILKGSVRNEGDFNKMFDEQIKSVEDKLQMQGFEFFIPLQKNIKDFGIKKVLLKKHLRSLPEQSPKISDGKYQAEKWFESKDKLIAGKIDMLIEFGQDAEIIDFKTGTVTQDVLDDSGEIFSDVKEEYKEQLKLYACLYFENTGRFPTSLRLIDLAKQKFIISFSPSECNFLFEEAKRLLQSTNENINKRTFVANPTEANCKYCLYRPACSYYLKLIETDYSFNDVSGSIKKLVKYENGHVSVFLQNGEKLFTVNNLPSEKYEELNDNRSKKISIYNLRKEATEFVYSATKTTMIYA
ncbi:PD-(D/E)XK nuclease family protein [Flavobacterium filum]|uniref:PD-(D/E)XK nuclease family protein n=1 Tax=Flavobacterium filum TaxID=370974 RepID=UPI0019DF33F9|nr:PD-(D/E)XK nuclease family protein [Flavobacterium filum]MBE2188189.1 PD-(D/E)XK nuclease family protein [Candidatus Kapabacteria bacterium]